MICEEDYIFNSGDGSRSILQGVLTNALVSYKFETSDDAQAPLTTITFRGTLQGLSDNIDKVVQSIADQAKQGTGTILMASQRKAMEKGADDILIGSRQGARKIETI